MTTEQKRTIDSLRKQGFGYKRIATEMGISENTVKSYIRRVNIASDAPVEAPAPAQEPTPEAVQTDHHCQYCGRVVPQNPGRKKKKFCSDEHRAIWWNEHLDQVKRKAIYHFTCPACGKDFTAY